MWNVRIFVSEIVQIKFLPLPLHFFWSHLWSSNAIADLHPRKLLSCLPAVPVAILQRNALWRCRIVVVWSAASRTALSHTKTLSSVLFFWTFFPTETLLKIGVQWFHGIKGRLFIMKHWLYWYSRQSHYTNSIPSFAHEDQVGS